MERIVVAPDYVDNKYLEHSIDGAIRKFGKTFDPVATQIRYDYNAAKKAMRRKLKRS